MFWDKRIFMDHASTTPLLLSVKISMWKHWSRHFHNPSAFYREGVRAKQYLETYRARVSRALGVLPRDIVYTAGGTEANNLAILGTFERAKKLFKHPHLIVSAVEHSSILEVCKEVERRGGKYSIAPVESDGFVDPTQVMSLVGPDTFLISVMLANNEIGVLEPVGKIGRLIRERRMKEGTSYPYLHTDASQAVNYVSLNMERLQADLLTLDGSKMYGPKGAGILVTRPIVDMVATTYGGAQERGLRSGTESLALIAGVSSAFVRAQRDVERESQRIERLRNLFIQELEKLGSSVIIRNPKPRVPNIVSVSVPNMSSEFLVLALDRAGVMTSVGSACKALGAEDGSSVITAIGRPDLASSTVRFSMGRRSNTRDVLKTAEIFSQILKHGKIIQ